MRRSAIPAAALLLVTLTATPAAAVDKLNSKKLRDAVTVSGMLRHERALQRIANNNGGTRASGTPGYAASAAYVTSTLKKAGYQVSEQSFTFPFFRELAPSTLAQTAPTPATFETSTMTYSGSGDVTGALVATNDVMVPPGAAPNSSDSGCEATDFVPASATEPQVALIQRGTCTFELKVTNAVAAGYDAVAIFNEGQPGRDDLLEGTLGKPFAIPVVGLDFADGATLYTAAEAGPVTVQVTTSTESDLAAKTSNIIANSPTGSAKSVIVVGAHLDSVVEGPGINDNGSGVATLLEIAVQLAKLKIKPRQQIRFAFWGAEESGLLGSEHYVANLSDDDLAKIYANLNFDMVGSPNYVRFVYDGDGSATPNAGPPGSAQIEEIFDKYFAKKQLATEPTAFDGRSDYGPFIEVGIPAGGLFSGAEGIKTAEQAAVYGGTAGVAYDKCYHAACDTSTNLNPSALHELGDAAAHAVYTLALTKTGLFPDGSLRATGRARVATPQFDYKGSHLIR
ncbi:MAG TPA: M28 family metallopeptidase [Actinoplanes sp.]|nr:M28 family metallopeptidase [Actinoplanes sp.]